MVIIPTELIIDWDAEDRASNFIKNPGNLNSAIPWHFVIAAMESLWEDAQFENL